MIGFLFREYFVGDAQNNVQVAMKSQLRWSVNKWSMELGYVSFLDHRRKRYLTIGML